MAEARAGVDPGLCARCTHAAVQSNPRGSRFWRCRAADREPALRRYPPLPVARCGAFTEGVPSALPSPGKESS